MTPRRPSTALQDWPGVLALVLFAVVFTLVAMHPGGGRPTCMRSCGGLVVSPILGAAVLDIFVVHLFFAWLRAVFAESRERMRQRRVRAWYAARPPEPPSPPSEPLPPGTQIRL